MSQRNYKKEIIGLAHREGLVRPRDLEHAGIPRAYLQRLMAEGELIRLGRGLYALPSYAPSELATIAEACKRVPKGIICLLSALRIHGLSTQNPSEVWMMIHRQAWRPRIEYPQLRIVTASGEALIEGVITKQLDGVKTQITSPAKTVADCFRYRNKVGLDVAIEALRDCRHQRLATLDEISGYAKIDRVMNVMRPYMESLQ